MKSKKTWNYTVKQCNMSELEDFVNGMDNQGYDLINSFPIQYKKGRSHYTRIVQIYKSREDIESIS